MQRTCAQTGHQSAPKALKVLCACELMTLPELHADDAHCLRSAHKVELLASLQKQSVGAISGEVLVGTIDACLQKGRITALGELPGFNVLNDPRGTRSLVRLLRPTVDKLHLGHSFILSAPVAILLANRTTLELHLALSLSADRRSDLTRLARDFLARTLRLFHPGYHIW